MYVSQRRMALPWQAELTVDSAGAQLSGPVGNERKERKPTISLTLVSFAVTRKAYARITEAFCREYEAATGQPIRFRLSFGGSGTQVCAPVAVRM